MKRENSKTNSYLHKVKNQFRVYESYHAVINNYNYIVNSKHFFKKKKETLDYGIISKSKNLNRINV
ncbi:hypothetical protein IW20_03345 [Flavobacterium hydatis]|jgi:hypothetical protein|uniref:Uncharacterized protein n=1 Tax=Flavobacterium hydatis TaxID=991 RepID=A0A086AS61_FLAHY|nr:hypothetical protein IW20_03345 [Flavobacterium hydatis]